MLPGGKFASGGDDGEGAVESATPHYNNAVLADARMQLHLTHLASVAAACPHFAEATLLLKVWLRQRGMRGDAAGTLGGFGASMVLAHVIESRRAFGDSSSFQLFRAAVVFLASGEMADTGVAMRFTAGDGDEAPPVPLEVFRGAFDVVLVDPTGTVNILASMTKGQHAHLQRAATVAVSLLDDEGTDGFGTLFIRRVDFHASFDVLLCCSGVTSAVVNGYPAHFLSRGGDWQAFAGSLVPALVARALGMLRHPLALCFCFHSPTRAQTLFFFFFCARAKTICTANMSVGTSNLACPWKTVIDATRSR
jgi:hypothetical protein